MEIGKFLGEGKIFKISNFYFPSLILNKIEIADLFWKFSKEHGSRAGRSNGRSILSSACIVSMWKRIFFKARR